MRKKKLIQKVEQLEKELNNLEEKVNILLENFTKQKEDEYFKNYKYDSDIKKELKKLRLEIADELYIEPIYYVFNNKTLDELYDVHGLGENKISQFGEYIINFFNNENEVENIKEK